MLVTSHARNYSVAISAPHKINCQTSSLRQGQRPSLPTGRGNGSGLCFRRAALGMPASILPHQTLASDGLANGFEQSRATPKRRQLLDGRVSRSPDSSDGCGQISKS